MRFLNRKVPTVTPIEMKQEQFRFNPEGGNCKDGMKTARSFQLGGWPSWSRVRSSSADGRAGHVFDPSRRMAELVAHSIQLGGWPSWSCCRSSSAICRTGLVQLGGWSRVRSSSVDGRAGRVFVPARPSAELDWFSLADSRAGRVVDPARPSAELDGVLCPPFNKTDITYVT